MAKKLLMDDGLHNRKSMLIGNYIHGDFSNVSRNDILESVKDFGAIYAILPDEYKNDKEILLAALTPDNPKFIQEHIESVNRIKDMAGSNINVSKNLLAFAPDRLKADKDVVLTAIKYVPESFKYADDRLKNSKDFNIEVVNVNPKVFEFVNDDFKADKDVVMAAATKDAEMFKYASDDLRSDVQFVRDVIVHDGYGGNLVGRSIPAYVSDTLWNEYRENAKRNPRDDRLEAHDSMLLGESFEDYIDRTTVREGMFNYIMRVAREKDFEAVSSGTFDSAAFYPKHPEWDVFVGEADSSDTSHS